MMLPTVTDPDLQRVVRDSVTGRQRELDQLQVLGQGAAAISPAGTPSTAAGGADAIIESYDIYFEPRELTIPAGTEVMLTLPNEGVTLHNFSIDALGISVDIGPGATEEAVISAPA
jgi:heme/copper-type cytochrome/quinol oxidase subunit 2